jgi:hypothetical protein
MAGATKSIVLALGIIGTASPPSSGAHHQQESVANVAWEQSQSVSVRLSVKGHEFDALSVDAECFVEGPPPHNLRSRRHVNLERDKDHRLYFPEDFQRKPVRGEYRWGCTVGGRTIAEGKFEYVAADQARVIR